MGCGLGILNTPTQFSTTCFDHTSTTSLRCAGAAHLRCNVVLQCLEQPVCFGVEIVEPRAQVLAQHLRLVLGATTSTLALFRQLGWVEAVAHSGAN